jgi:hypothetical protein
MIEILNQFILRKFVNNTTSFKKLHSIIYSGALTIIRLNGVRVWQFYPLVLPCVVLHSRHIITK